MEVVGADNIFSFILCNYNDAYSLFSYAFFGFFLFTIHSKLQETY